MHLLPLARINAVNSATNVIYVLDCQHLQGEGTVATSQKKYESWDLISLDKLISIRMNIHGYIAEEMQH